MNEIQGFKVVRRSEPGTLVSAVMYSNPGLRTIYEKGKAAHNVNGPLMFFPELVDAENFTIDYLFYQLRYVEIWSCTTINALPTPHVLQTGNLSPERVRAWWMHESSEFARLVESPPGTMVADTITLIERVDG